MTIFVTYYIQSKGDHSKLVLKLGATLYPPLITHSRTHPKAIEKAIAVIQNTAQKVNSAMRNIESRPDHVEVEFGIKFDAEVGVILAKASTEASLNVTLSWG